MFISLIDTDLIKCQQLEGDHTSAIVDLISSDKQVVWRTVHSLEATELLKARKKWRQIYRLVFSHVDLNTVRQEALRNRYAYDRHAINVNGFKEFLIVEEVDGKFDELFGSTRLHIINFDPKFDGEPAKELIEKLHGDLRRFATIHAKERMPLVEELAQQIKELP